MTDPANPPGGAISVIDEHGQNTLRTPDIAQFMIVSHGISKQQGVYTTAGVRTACPAAGNSTTEISEDENCNDDKTFVISAVYEGTGAIRSDDYAINDMTTNAAPDDSPISYTVLSK